MVYIYTGTLNTVIKNLRIFDIYPSLKNTEFLFENYFYQNFQSVTTYQSSPNRIFLRCRKYLLKKAGMDYSTNPATQIPFQTYLKQEVTKVQTLTVFDVYNSHEINDFKCCDFLIKFFGLSIDVIIDRCKTINFAQLIPSYLVTNVEITNILKKIFTIHLLVTLSKALKIVDILLNMNAIDVLPFITKNNTDVFNIIMKYIQKTDFKTIDDTDKLILSNIITLNKHLFKDIYKSKENTCRVIDVLIPKFKRIMAFFLDLSVTSLYKHIESKPDMIVAVANMTKNIKKLNYNNVIKILRIDFLFLENIISQNYNVDINSLVPLENLKIPQKSILRKKLIIEV